MIPAGLVWAGLLALFLVLEAAALLDKRLGNTFSEWVWGWPLPLRVALAIVLIWAAYHFVSGNCWPFCAP